MSKFLKKIDLSGDWHDMPSAERYRRISASEVSMAILSAIFTKVNPRRTQGYNKNPEAYAAAWAEWEELENWAANIAIKANKERDRK